jgi:hypothetical protein
MKNSGFLTLAIIVGSVLVLSFFGCIGLMTIGAYQVAQEEEQERILLAQEEERERKELKEYQEQLEREQNKISLLAKGKTYRDLTLKQLGDLKHTLRTAWREGTIYYDFQVSPYKYDYLSDTAYNPIGHWTIHLEDANGFEITKINIYRSSMIRGTNDNGSYTDMSIKGSVSMSRDMYEQISSWNISWSRY